MEIQEIKKKLTLATVLHHYNLKPDKNLRLNFPFHEDKTPSLPPTGASVSLVPFGL